MRPCDLNDHQKASRWLIETRRKCHEQWDEADRATGLETELAEVLGYTAWIPQTERHYNFRPFGSSYQIFRLDRANVSEFEMFF